MLLILTLVIKQAISKFAFENKEEDFSVVLRLIKIRSNASLFFCTALQ